jgi:hypothetical protein
MLDELPDGDAFFVQAGYIRVFQDVRGKYGSEGEHVMTPPPTGLSTRTAPTTPRMPMTPSTGW